VIYLVSVVFSVFSVLSVFSEPSAFLLFFVFLVVFVSVVASSPALGAPLRTESVGPVDRVRKGRGREYQSFRRDPWRRPFECSAFTQNGKDSHDLVPAMLIGTMVADG
jgi:hypothetical protein